MSRHILDHSKSETENSRLRAYLKIEREQGDLHPATRALHSRSGDRAKDSASVAEFLRIERGHQA